MSATRVLSPPPVRLLPAPQRLRGHARAPLAARLAAGLPAGWPLKYLLVPFPLWWALGLSTLAFVLFAVPMAIHVWRVHRAGALRLPPAFALWALFLAWQVLGLGVIGQSPPGTHPGSTGGRLISISYTLVVYAAITVTMIYVGNLAATRVPQSAIARWLGWFFFTVCAGGYLGMLLPKLSFNSVLEIALPRSITANGFVRSLVHPVAAQVQDVIGVGDARPAAPFGYTNSWGNALSLLLIWFVAGWVLPARGARRALYALIALASLVPVIYSLNRGLWVGIAFTVVWLLMRQLLRGHLGVVLAALSAAAAAAVGFTLSPLARIVSGRLQHGVSDDIRSFVAGLSVRAIRYSPVLGYGSNRHANGSSASIAIGPTPSCPTCGDVATGSTGQLWSLLFNQGVIGALLYFGFFFVALCVFWNRTGPLAEAALVTVALTFVYMLFYSALPVAPTITVIAVAVLWREASGSPSVPPSTPPSTRRVTRGTSRGR